LIKKLNKSAGKAAGIMKNIPKSSAGKTPAKITVSCEYSGGDRIRRKCPHCEAKRRKIFRYSCGFISARKPTVKLIV